jgi:hypothetical protein
MVLRLEREREFENLEKRLCRNWQGFMPAGCGSVDNCTVGA